MAGVLILPPSTPATALQTQVKSVEETYGTHNLHLTVTRGHIAEFLANTRLVRWPTTHQQELGWDDDFPPHGSVNSLRGLLGYAGLYREGRPVFDLHMHLADNVFGLFGLEVAEDAELDKI